MVGRRCLFTQAEMSVRGCSAHGRSWLGVKLKVIRLELVFKLIETRHNSLKRENLEKKTGPRLGPPGASLFRSLLQIEKPAEETEKRHVDSQQMSKLTLEWASSCVVHKHKGEGVGSAIPSVRGCV